jgi:hexosaminidase
MGQERVAPGHPKLLGAQWALWNDNSFRRDTGLTDYDLFDRIQKSSAVMAEKTWSTGTDRPYAAFAQLLEQVGDAPGVHRYQVQTRTPLALDLRVIDGKWGDHSGNGYSPTEMEQVRVSASGALELQGGRSFVRNAVANIAPDYVAEFRVRRSSASTDPQILFESHTGQFWAVQKQTGRIGLTRDTWDYSFDYTLPVGKWVDLKLVATGRSLTLFANGEKVGGPVRHRYPDALRYNTFIFPMEYLGSRTQAFEGQIQNLNVTVVPPPDMSRAVPSSQLEIRASSEHGVGADGDIQKTIDGDPGTYWHSRYAPNDEPPFVVEIRLNTPTRIDMLSFLPRQDMNNGAIRSARLLVKSGKSDWEEVATYTGTGSERSRQAVAFSPRTVDAVKWIITEGVGGFGTMAEINLHSVR